MRSCTAGNPIFLFRILRGVDTERTHDAEEHFRVLLPEEFLGLLPVDRDIDILQVLRVGNLDVEIEFRTGQELCVIDRQDADIRCLDARREHGKRTAGNH